jgi:hypothetical protein
MRRSQKLALRIGAENPDRRTLIRDDRYARHLNEDLVKADD